MGITRRLLSIFGPRGLACPLGVMVTLWSPCNALAGGEPDSATRAARERFFEQSVRPVLAENCYSCHGPKKQKGGLRLDSLAAILKGGDSGPAVAAGKPAESLLIEAVNYAGLEMPPQGKLAPEKVAALARWVAVGAPWPSSANAAHAPAAVTHLDGSKTLLNERPVWSLQPVRQQVVPAPGSTASASSGWCRNPIDGFILQALSRNGLTPAPEADKPTLIRRVTFDLTGLPPSIEAIDAFMADDVARGL